MDLTVLNLALPKLSAELAPSSAQTLWIVDIYGFLVAGCLITMGNLGDRIGRRRLLLIGASAFGLASVLAAFATSPGLLIAARALLGVTGATLAPSTLSLIRNMFADPRERTLAIGVWTTSFSVGATIGPVLGGAILQAFWWGSVFLLAVPVMILLLVLGPWLLPEYRDDHAGPLDPLSALLSLVAVLGAIYGLKLWASRGLDAEAALSIAGGLAFGLVFVRRQLGLAHPLVDLKLFRRLGFSVSLGTYTIMSAIGFGSYVLCAQYMQLVLGFSPMQAGLWTLPGSVAVVTGSMLAPIIVRRVRPEWVIFSGFALAAIGFCVLSQLSAFGLSGLVAGTSLIYLGMGPVVTVGTDLVVGAVPPERAGAAAALSETSSELGGALGIAILGSLATLSYRTSMTRSAEITGLSPEARASAFDTLSGAVHVAPSLADPGASALLATARDAFTQALQLSAAGCAVIAAAAAVIAVIVLRRVGSEPSPVEPVSQSRPSRPSQVPVFD
jgi:DHA2 family multidrug resistance protein-like MFS transporter